MDVLDARLNLGIVKKKVHFSYLIKKPAPKNLEYHKRGENFVIQGENGFN